MPPIDIADVLSEAIDNIQATTNPVTELLGQLKVRHLNKNERRVCHAPTSDHITTSCGEVYRGTDALSVSDIISKYIT